MKKSLIYLLTASLMAGTLMGCSSSSSKDTASNDKEIQAKTTSEDTESTGTGETT